MIFMRLASSAIVIPGCLCTCARTSCARPPVPRGRPGPRAVVLALAVRERFAAVLAVPAARFPTPSNASSALRTGPPVLKRSAIPLGLDDATDRFKSISRPELVLEGEAHAIMTPTRIAILNRSQFQFLVGDIGLVGQYVPAQIKLIASRLKQHGVLLSAKTGKAIEAKAAGSVQLAKRLDAFLERIDQIDVSRIANGRGFTAQDLTKKDFVNAKGELDCADGWTLGRAQATLAYTAHFVHGLAVLARLLWACAGIIGLLVWMCLRLGLTLVHCLVGGNGPRISGGRRATPSLSLPRSVTHGRKRVRKPCPRWCDGGFGPCELCGGTGYRGWHTCRRCNGTKRSKCSRCHGTGEVWGYE